MKVTIYLPLVFVRKEKHQGLQELFYWVQRKPIQLFMESYSGTTQHYWLHASLTISALPLDLDGKSFGISLFSYTAQ